MFWATILCKYHDLGGNRQWTHCVPQHVRSDRLCHEREEEEVSTESFLTTYTRRETVKKVPTIRPTTKGGGGGEGRTTKEKDLFFKLQKLKTEKKFPWPLSWGGGGGGG